ncbi:uncharacterized protein LOC134275698 [Saccostrea cucullata]|uniref:uncharacterized protein LOC134236436 n=1 Tax=Saccostrea cuccullata TaxID=36930 RepID=UPI002ED28F47
MCIYVITSFLLTVHPKYHKTVCFLHSPWPGNKNLFVTVETFHFFKDLNVRIIYTNQILMSEYKQLSSDECYLFTSYEISIDADVVFTLHSCIPSIKQSYLSHQIRNRHYPHWVTLAETIWAMWKQQSEIRYACTDNTTVDKQVPITKDIAST